MCRKILPKQYVAHIGPNKHKNSKIRIKVSDEQDQQERGRIKV